MSAFDQTRDHVEVGWARGVRMDAGFWVDGRFVNGGRSLFVDVPGVAYDLQEGDIAFRCEGESSWEPVGMTEVISVTSVMLGDDFGPYYLSRGGGLTTKEIELREKRRERLAAEENTS